MAKRRRGKGEGTIQRRADQRYMARLDLGYVNGKRVRKCFYGATRAEVAELLNEARHNRRQGGPIPIGRRTVADFIRGWLDTIKPPVKRASTYQSYELLHRLHIEPTIGRIQLAKLDAPAIQALLSAKLREGLAPTSVRHVRTVLRRALNVALKQRLIFLNPATLIDDLPVPERHEINALKEQEASRLLEAAKGSRVEAIIAVAVRLGLRRGELLGLLWQDVDLDNRRMSVIRALQRVNGQPLALVPLKTRGSRRDIELPAEVIKALRAHRTRQLQQRLAAGTKWSENGLIFCNTIGKFWEPRAIDTAFKRVLPKAGLANTTRFHDLRHTCATLLLERGASIYEVSKLLGHSSISITADIYGHFSEGMKHGLAKKMDTILSAEA